MNRISAGRYWKHREQTREDLRWVSGWDILRHAPVLAGILGWREVVSVLYHRLVR